MLGVFCEEFKRLCRNRTVWTLSVLSVMLSVLLVYVVISNVSYGVPGQPSFRAGADAITHAKATYAPSCGPVTPEKLEAALKTYQDTADAYPGGVVPDAVREEKTAPLAPVLNLILNLYDTPFMPVENAADFYQQRDKVTHKNIEKQYPDLPAIQEAALSINQKIETPFYYAYGYGDSEGPEFLVLLLLVLILFCAIIAATAFSEDYNSRADDIQRCTRYVRLQLGTARLLAMYVLVLLLALVCTGIYLVSLNAVFGWEGLKASLQTRYFITAITPMTIGGVMGATLLSGVLTLLATASCAMLVSSRCRVPMAALAASVVITMLPVFLAFLHIDVNGLTLLLPSSGVAASASFYQALTQNSLVFLHLGTFVLWMPTAYILYAAVEIPLFGLLIIWSYTSREVD